MARAGARSRLRGDSKGRQGTSRSGISSAMRDLTLERTVDADAEALLSARGPPARGCSICSPTGARAAPGASWTIPWGRPPSGARPRLRASYRGCSARPRTSMGSWRSSAPVVTEEASSRGVTSHDSAGERGPATSLAGSGRSPRHRMPTQALRVYRAEGDARPGPKPDIARPTRPRRRTRTRVIPWPDGARRRKKGDPVRRGRQRGPRMDAFRALPHHDDHGRARCSYGAYVDRPWGRPRDRILRSRCVRGSDRQRGALAGHLAALEMTSSPPNRAYANGFRRLGFDDDAVWLFDEHVEADSVHEASSPAISPPVSLWRSPSPRATSSSGRWRWRCSKAARGRTAPSVAGRRLDAPPAWRAAVVSQDLSYILLY